MTTDQNPDLRAQLLDALDFAYCQGLGYDTPEALLDAYDAERGVPVPPPADQTALLDRIAEAPVKQRADLTEAEWAEQERARFERLYTRETVRADTAARDAGIYRQRLERLGEGYTRERKRAERAEAEAERLRTFRDATCICGHTEPRHFEDTCLVCDCGDYLVPEAAREVIERWRQAAVQARADRATVLLEAAQHLYTALFPAVYADMGQKAAEGVNRAVSELRRVAAEEQPAETRASEAHPPSHTWTVESPRRDNWASWGATYDDRDWAVERCESAASTAPQRPFRLVRATTTYTVEAEHTPPAVGEQPETQETRVVAYVLAVRTELHCLRCTPNRAGDIWTPVTSEELEDGGICTVCGVDVLIPQEANRG